MKIAVLLVIAYTIVPVFTDYADLVYSGAAVYFFLCIAHKYQFTKHGELYLGEGVQISSGEVK